jgi:hypothetical protein
VRRDAEPAPWLDPRFATARAPWRARIENQEPSGRRLGECLVALLAEAERGHHVAVALEADALEVVEQAPPLRHEAQQAPPRVVVLDVGLEVLGEVDDPLGQQRDLDLGGAGVVLVRAELGDDLGLLFGVEGHGLSRASARRGRRLRVRSPPAGLRPRAHGRGGSEMQGRTGPRVSEKFRLERPAMGGTSGGGAV